MVVGATGAIGSVCARLLALEVDHVILATGQGTDLALLEGSGVETVRGFITADPKTLIAGPSSASVPKPSTNSAWIRSTRQGSACTQSVGPRESRRRWSVSTPPSPP